MAKLEIFIVTYNREAYLKTTLEYLRNSVFKDYNITVLNNSSTDNTEAVLAEMSLYFSNFKFITHKNNVGGDANIMKAIELSSSTYTWVLCDDDTLDFSEVDDVLAVIEEGEVDLIHTGAHPDGQWVFGGKKATPLELLRGGYHYFKAASFLPCNIFKTEEFQKNFLIAGYHNIKNRYPVMPYVYDAYEKEKIIYLSKKQITIASMVGQSYNLDNWFFWWLNSSLLLKSNEGVRAAFFDHFNENNNLKPLYGLMAELASKNESFHNTIISFVSMYFTGNEKLGFYRAQKLGKFKRLKSSIKRGMNKYYKFNHGGNN